MLVLTITLVKSSLHFEPRRLFGGSACEGQITAKPCQTHRIVKLCVIVGCAAPLVHSTVETLVWIPRPTEYKLVSSLAQVTSTSALLHYPSFVSHRLLSDL
ncbi:hypothetical protein PMIN03_007608 [Paraphaeosphaeria minitans]